MTKRYCIVILCFALLLLWGGGAHATIPRSDPFAVSWDTRELAVAPGHRFHASLTVYIPPEHYLFAEELDLEFITLEGIHIDEVHFLPVGEVAATAEVTGKKLYTGNVTIAIEGHVPKELDFGRRELVARISFRGCAAERCFHPRSEDVTLALNVSSETVATGEPEGERLRVASFRALLAGRDFAAILEYGLSLAILIIFVAGVLSSLAPCIWPILPIVLVVVGVERQRSVVRNCFLALSIVVGLMLTYAAMGIISVATGRAIGFVFQQRWFIALVVIFFVFMSLSVFGIVKVRFSPRWSSCLRYIGGKGFRGAFLSGLGLGLLASPCTGAVIAALLAYVALQRNYLMGFILLSVFALGMGSVIVLMGLAYGVVANRLRVGPWMRVMRRMLALVLLIPAVFYMVTFLDIDGAKPALEGPSVEWINRIDDGMRFARRDDRPIMLNFYAAWCLPCRQLDRFFFNRETIARLSYQLVPVRIEATYESAEIRRLVERYQIMGFPTIVFLGPTGEEYVDLRVVVSDAAQIEGNMREALRRAGIAHPLSDYEDGEE